MLNNHFINKFTAGGPGSFVFVDEVNFEFSNGENNKYYGLMDIDRDVFRLLETYEFSPRYLTSLIHAKVLPGTQAHPVVVYTRYKLDKGLMESVPGYINK